MSKIDGIMGLLEAGMKAEGLRQKAIASNVANMETPGYRRYDIKFDEQLQKAIAAGGDIDSEQIEPEMYQPMATEVNGKGNDVNFEREVGGMIENTIKHKAYSRLLAKKYKQMELAINTG